MIWWVLALAVLTILSYLSDVGSITFLQNLRVPGLNASLLSVLILLCMAGILGRMRWMVKKGQKEDLLRRISELEERIKTLQEERKE